MPLLRSTVLLDAPPRTVAGLVRDVGFAAAAGGRVGHTACAARRLLAAGDEVRVVARLLPGVRVELCLVVGTVSETGMTAVRVAGSTVESRPTGAGGAEPGHTALCHAVTLTPTATGTLLLDKLSWRAPFGPAGRVADALLLRRLARRWLAARAAVLTERVASLHIAPVVVATAVIRDGRVLAAQRTRPPSLAGRWELPGGRVEAGESEPDAVARECREELAVMVRATGRLGTDLPIDAGVLRVHTAELVVGEPRALEHAALRWVGPAELDGVDWVDADRAVLADLHALLGGKAPATAGPPPGPAR